MIFAKKLIPNWNVIIKRPSWFLVNSFYIVWTSVCFSFFMINIVYSSFVLHEINQLIVVWTWCFFVNVCVFHKRIWCCCCQIITLYCIKSSWFLKKYVNFYSFFLDQNIGHVQQFFIILSKYLKQSA